MEMVLTGDTMTAEQAQDYGLVNRVVPEKELEQAVEELLTKLSQQSGPVLQLTKRAILEAMGKTFRDALRNTEDIFLNELSKLEDPREGLRAVLEKRKPQWRNR
jgi:enoyl-CoA hydratase/carnithine racemase